MSDEKAVVVAVTPSITLRMDDNMNCQWRAVCPLDDGWRQYADTRTEAERLLHNHLGTHNTEQGSMF